MREELIITKDAQKRPGLIHGEIIAMKRETKDTHTFTIKFDNLFEWTLGQFLMVQADIGGKSVRRAYTISSSPTRKNIEITVRQTEDPTMSKYLNERKLGDILNIKGPYGKFIWTEGMSTKVVSIGAGSGITPTRAFLQYFADRALNIPIKVLYSCSYGDNVIFEREIPELVKKVINGSYSLSITRDKMGLTDVREGRLNKVFFETELEEWKDAYYYLCGTPPFVKSMIELLLEIGVPQGNIKKEKWG